MPLRSLLRIVLYSFVVLLVAVVLWLRTPVTSERAPAVDTPEPPPAVRLARDDQPTIVEPNDGWLHTHHDGESEAGHLSEAPSTVLLPADAPTQAREPLSR